MHQCMEWDTVNAIVIVENTAEDGNIGIVHLCYIWVGHDLSPRVQSFGKNMFVQDEQS